MLAGFALESICPDRPMELAGYDLRKEPSSGVLDEINANALALVSDEGEKFLLLSFDLLGVPRPFCAEMKRLIGEKASMPQNNVWIAATHTHAAPRAVINRKSGDEAYIELLKAASLRAAERAFAAAEPVTSEIGYLRLDGIASLRDVSRERSRYSMPLVRMLLTGAGGQTEIIRFACHPTVLDEKNTLLSRDLAGARGNARRIMLNGACGDLSTRYTRQGKGVTELERLKAALNAGIGETQCAPLPLFARTIRALSADIALKQAEPLTEEYKRALIAHHERRLAELSDEEAKRELISIIAVLKRPPRQTEPMREVTVCAADMGALVFLGLPFEINSADGEKIERELADRAGKPVILLCYTGGYDGYLPSGRPIDENSCYQDMAASLSPEARSQVMEQAKTLIEKLTEEGK